MINVTAVISNPTKLNESNKCNDDNLINHFDNNNNTTSS